MSVCRTPLPFPSVKACTRKPPSAARNRRPTEAPRRTASARARAISLAISRAAPRSCTASPRAVSAGSDSPRSTAISATASATSISVIPRPSSMLQPAGLSARPSRTLRKANAIDAHAGPVEASIEASTGRAGHLAPRASGPPRPVSEAGRRPARRISSPGKETGGDIRTGRERPTRRRLTRSRVSFSGHPPKPLGQRHRDGARRPGADGAANIARFTWRTLNLNQTPQHMSRTTGTGH